MSKLLVDRLACIAGLTPSKAHLARERLPRLIEYARRLLQEKRKPPSIRPTNKTIEKVQSDIKRLQTSMRLISEDELIELHGLKRRNWSHLRNIDVRIHVMREQLSALSSLLEVSKLGASRGADPKQYLHDIVVTCAFFFWDFSEHEISKVPTSPFSKFLDELLRELGHKEEVTSIVRACLSEKATQDVIKSRQRLREMQAKLQMESD